jgi:hypothetical protein
LAKAAFTFATCCSKKRHCPELVTAVFIRV